MLSLLIRSERLAPEQLQATCTQLTAKLRERLAESDSGRIHLLPAHRNLLWLEYTPDMVTAGIVTVAAFGPEWITRPVPALPDATIVVEYHLKPLTEPYIFEEPPPVAALTRQFTEILAQCGLRVQESCRATVQF
jgi:hypothetical protein